VRTALYTGDSAIGGYKSEIGIMQSRFIQYVLINPEECRWPGGDARPSPGRSSAAAC
jgi:hypothetical protein